jgi:hypothetical protein
MPDGAQQCRARRETVPQRMLILFSVWQFDVEKKKITK